MSVEWGLPRQLEDYGVFIFLFGFHVVMGALFVSVRLPLDSFAIVPAFLLFVLCNCVLVGMRHVQARLFMTNRYPLSIFEATARVFDDASVSVMEWLVIFTGQSVGIALYWGSWLGYSLNAGNAVTSFMDVRFPMIVYTLVSAIVLCQHRPSEELSAKHALDTGVDTFFIMHSVISMGAVVYSYAFTTPTHEYCRVGLFGLYSYQGHATVTFYCFAIVHAACHMLLRLVFPMKKK